MIPISTRVALVNGGLPAAMVAEAYREDRAAEWQKETKRRAMRRFLRSPFGKVATAGVAAFAAGTLARDRGWK